MKKHLLLAAMLLTATASVGTFSACSNEEIKPSTETTKVEGTTSMSVQFALQLPDPAVLLPTVKISTRPNTTT